MRWLYEVPEYSTEAFKPEAGRMRLYGKADTPPAPDYTAAANATAAGNLEAARVATKANRVNQYGPYGSVTYQQTNPGTFDQAGYDAAMAAWGQQKDTPGTPGYWQTNGREGGDAWVPGTAGTTRGEMPTRAQFTTGGDPDLWTQTTTLSPVAQDTINKQIALSNEYADIAGKGLASARAGLENPNLDVSQLPARAINVGQTAQDAILSRLNPQFEADDKALRARLANQGIVLGSEAYGREMGLAGQRMNDARQQAALAGIALDQNNRSSALQEQAYLQDRPLNLINALRTGAQVQSPQFQQVPQQATTAGPNLLGAAQAQYGAAVDAANAENAQSAGMLNGLFGVGLGLAGLPGANGSILGGIKGLFG